VNRVYVLDLCISTTALAARSGDLAAVGRIQIFAERLICEIRRNRALSGDDYADLALAEPGILVRGARLRKSLD